MLHRSLTWDSKFLEIVVIILLLESKTLKQYDHLFLRYRLYAVQMDTLRRSDSNQVTTSS